MKDLGITKTEDTIATVEDVDEKQEIKNVDSKEDLTMVKITVPALNIRSGPSYNNKNVDILKDKDGEYAIKKKVRNWGLLEDETGWICLDFVETV